MPGTNSSIFVIFGITGDLAQRKLLPALYHLFKDGLLDGQTEIVGISRRAVSREELLEKAEVCILEEDNVCDPDVLALMQSKIRMLQLDLTDGNDYERLRKELDTIETAAGHCMNRLYYLSVPPQTYEPIVRHLGEHGHNTGCSHGIGASRLLIEKPFGYDLASAEDLIHETNEQFREEQIYRIDHYLAKETAQNILAFRAANAVFQPVWNNRFISRIDVLASERVGVEGRATFYDNVGALRDLVQSHLLQLLALVTMELPAKLSDRPALHASRRALLESITPYGKGYSLDVVRGQYDTYRTEISNPESTTETFVSLGLHIDTEAWAGVPIRITTGKALADKKTEIIITFAGQNIRAGEPNILTFRIQPNEGIDLTLNVKQPGFDAKLQKAIMDFSYDRHFSRPQHPDAYERVLVDAVRGDNALFATSDEVLASWHILQPVLDMWERSSSDLVTYPAGSQGPKIR